MGLMENFLQKPKPHHLVIAEAWRLASHGIQEVGPKIATKTDHRNPGLHVVLLLHHKTTILQRMRQPNKVLVAWLLLKLIPPPYCLVSFEKWDREFLFQKKLGIIWVVPASSEVKGYKEANSKVGKWFPLQKCQEFQPNSFQGWISWWVSYSQPPPKKKT